MQTDSLFHFVSYLAAHKLRFKFADRPRLVSAWSRGLRPPSPDFFRELPEFEIWRERAASFWEKGAFELAREAERGTRFLTPEDPEFPETLKSLEEPPWVLSVRGSIEALSAPSLSVVGAREPLPGSLAWMQEHLGFVLKRAPLALASGGARGVDQMAHRLCLRYERPTLIFVPSGLGALYPENLKDWVLPVLECSGALVSEFHPRAPMRKWHFQMRNRLIAGVSRGTLVVEARHRSGTWLTAQLALDLPRPLGVLPGSAIEPRQSGNVLLINAGATPICDAQDLVMFLKGPCQRPTEFSSSLGASSDVTH